MSYLSFLCTKSEWNNKKGSTKAFFDDVKNEGKNIFAFLWLSLTLCNFLSLFLMHQI